MQSTHEYEVQGNYGGGTGWELLTTEDTRTEARARLREYRENSPEGIYRIRPRVTSRTYRNTIITRNDDGVYVARVWLSSTDTTQVAANTLVVICEMIADTLSKHGLTRSVS